MFEDLSTLALGSCCCHSFRSLFKGGARCDSDSALRAKKSDWRESQGLPGDETVFENSATLFSCMEAVRGTEIFPESWVSLKEPVVRFPSLGGVD